MTRERELERLRAWMETVEAERLEFKEAKNNFDFEKLLKYCIALANEGGGVLVLGVSDRRPRSVVGTRAFEDIHRTKVQLVDKLRLRVDVDEIQHGDGRVLAFTIPSRPIGMPLSFDEALPDYSAEPVIGAQDEELDPVAIEKLRELWRRKSGNPQIERMSREELLRDSELAPDGRITIAALVLLGTRAGLGRHLAQSETVLEYRSSDTTIAPQQRVEFREGFLL